mmetsp:Transcript_10030/g.24186  ORF Transcript_10030/g.24186 Transcript_10030/m.24186 type:complete len:105 (-) Transcript_10030:159-473(-)
MRNKLTKAYIEHTQKLFYPTGVLGDKSMEDLLDLGEENWAELQRAFGGSNCASFEELVLSPAIKKEFKDLLEGRTSPTKRMLANSKSWGWLLMKAMCTPETVDR